MESVNTLIIGAGMSGLFAAAKLTGSGVSVMVCERKSFAGGLHGNVQVGRHFVPLTAYKAFGLHEGGRLSAFLGAGGTATRMQYSDHAFLPCGEDVRLPADPTAMQEILEARYPKQKSGIKTVMHTIALLYQAAGPSRKSGLSTEHIKALRETAGRTYENFVREHIDDPELIALLSLRIFSSQNDVITMAVYLGNIFWDGLYWVPDGSARLTEGLLRHIQESEAVDLRLATPVSQLVISGGLKVCGALLDQKTEVRAEHVICALDPAQLVKMLPSGDLRNELVRSLADAKPSLSAIVCIFIMSPAFSKKLVQHGQTARLHFCRKENLFDVYRKREAGKLDLDLVKVTWESSAGLDANNSQALPRIYLEIDCRLWKEAKEHDPISAAVAEQDPGPFFEILESIFPQASEQVEAFRIISPGEIENTTANSEGACSGWNNSARPSRLDSLLAQRGIHLVGQWSHYGTGLPMLEQAAEAVSRTVIRKNEGRHKQLASYQSSGS